MTFRSVPWTRQPQGAAGPAKSGAFTLSRESTLWLPARPEIITGRFPTAVGAGPGLTQRVSRFGVETVTAENYLRSPAPAMFSDVLSWLAIITPDSAPTSTGFSSLFQANQFTLNWNHASASYQGSFTIYNNGGYQTCKFTSGFTAGLAEVIAGTYDGTSLRVYRAGVLENTVTAANGASGLTPIAVEWIGGSGGTVPWLGGSSLFVWEPRRAWSAANVAELSANPWQLFAPRRIWVPQAAASGISSTFGVSLDSTGLAAAGTTTIVGQMARTLLGDSLAGQGTTTIVGSLTATLGTAVLAATGSVAGPDCALAATLSATTLAAAGTTTVTSTLAKTLENATLVATGNSSILSTFAKTLNDDTLVAPVTVGTPPISTSKLPLVGVGT